MIYTDVLAAFELLKNPEKATFLARFFKTGKGQYGEHDIFYGITVPEIRRIAKNYSKSITLDDIQELLKSPIHEIRFISVVFLVYLFEKTKDKKTIFDFYIKNTSYINNWDLVDVSAPRIVGAYLIDIKDRRILYQLAEMNHLWSERIAVVSTLTLIKNHNFDEILALSEFFLTHSHDLMHKAVGWMLREMGKKNKEVLCQFLDKNAPKMPRTMLRYAIERLPNRLDYLAIPHA